MRSYGCGKFVSGCVIVVVAATSSLRSAAAAPPPASPFSHAVRQSVAAWMSVVAFLADEDDGDDRGPRRDRGDRPLSPPGMARPPHGMGPMPRSAPMHDHAFRQLDEIIARLGRIEERLGVGSPGYGPHRAGGDHSERPQPPSRPEVPEEMRRAVEQRLQEGRRRMEEAHERMEDAKKKFREMEERIRSLEAEVRKLRDAGGDTSSPK